MVGWMPIFIIIIIIIFNKSFNKSYDNNLVSISIIMILMFLLLN